MDKQSNPSRTTAQASFLSDLLHSILLLKEEYRIMSAADNPDHWSRGYRTGYLEGLDKAIEMINRGV